MRSKFFSHSNLFILIAIIAAWWITAFKTEPFLYYYGQQIGFTTNLEFLKSSLVYPGGLSNYLADFVSQFFMFNSAGSFLIVLVASVQGLMAINIISHLTGKNLVNFAVFAIILLVGVLIMCDYNYPYHVSIRLLFVFMFTWLFSIIDSKFRKQSIYIWPVFAVFVFYLASGAALIVFAVSTSVILIHSQTKKIKLAAIPLFLIFAALLPYLSYKSVFPSTLINVYRLAEIKHPEILAYTTFYKLYAYYLVLPVALLLVFILKIIPVRKSEEKTVKRKILPKESFYKKMPFVITVQVIFVVLLGYFMFLKSYDSFKKNILYIDYYAQNENWRKVLEVAEEITVYDFRVDYHVTRAYAMLGQLPERLFNYPQLLGSKGIFFESANMIGSLTMPTSDLYFDLGLMSEAQHWAFEAQTLLPNSPRILKRLVMINLVNRKYDLADKFLKVLDQNMLYHDWVDKYEKYVTDTTLAANDKVIAEKRRFTPHKRAINDFPVENLKLLIETNKDNRLAYDYLLALCMLDINYPEFVNYVQHYRYYNLKTLPSSWAEALAVYIVRSKSIPSFVSDETISNEVKDRFTAFNELMKRYNNKDSAKNEARQKFEHTFWYYLLYLNPKVTNALNNKSVVR